MKARYHFLSALVIASAFLSAISCDPKVYLPDDGDDAWTWNKDKPGEGGSGEGGASDTTPFYPKPAGSFRVMTYNVGVFSKYQNNSTDMVAAMIKELEADVVCLNELDSCNTRHNVNQVAMLASALGSWQWKFGKALDFRNGKYGNGVVVPKDVKIIDRYTVTLPKGSGSEQRSIAVVETDKYVIGAAHLEYSSVEAANAQAEVVNSWASKNYNHYDKPVFFCGDMNMTPDQAPIATLKGSWEILSETGLTYPSTNPTKCIDYIFHYKNSKEVKLLGSHVATKFHNGDVTKASDHNPVYVDVQF